MSKLPKILIGLGISLAVILIAVAFYLRHLVVKSFPDYNGNARLSVLQSPVDVYRDSYGIPHLRAQNETDLMKALGYVHAQDRLWQMDLMRRAGDGRLSEIFGETTIEFDKLFRTLDFRGLTDRLENQIHPESRQLLEAYAAGVNEYINLHRGKYPIEFDMLDYMPEPWTVRNSITLVRLIAWELNLSWWTDLTYGEIAGKVSAEKLQEIIPTYPDSVAPTVSSALQRPIVSGNVSALKGTIRSYRNFFGLGSLEAGSNAWAVDSSKSLSGKPLLANDPHLSMPAPARWYLVHLSSPDGWNVAGVSIPGTPVIVIGHNEDIAWGLTNAMLDDADYYIEETDSGKSTHYRSAEGSLPFMTRDEAIYIGKTDSLILTTRSTKHGPIISDVHPMHKHQDSSKHPLLAMRWTGFEMSDEVYGIMRINKAKHYRDFVEGCVDIAVPGQSIVFADKEGTIAYQTTGRVPIRSGKYNPMLPIPGSAADGQWQGFIPFHKLPRLANPSEGYVACSNQRIADASYPYYLSTLWEPPSRIERIRELLNSSERFRPDDFKQFQQDVTSPYARDVTQVIVNAFRDSTRREAEIEMALQYLENWDHRFIQSDIATTIFNAFMLKLLHNIYEDEMGAGLFNDFVYFGAIPYCVTSQLLAKDSSAWFDDLRTSDRIETKQDVIKQSLDDALREMRNLLGSEMKTWQWGALHTVTFKHPFGNRKPLDRVFNVGPFPTAGGGTTLNKSEYKFTLPYTVSVGPSMRQVVDMADPLVSYTVITSGQSGQPLHDHYDDQTPLWLNGGYIRMTMNWSEIEGGNYDHLTLLPSN